MPVPSLPQLVTAEQFIAEVDDGRKVDLLKGIIYVSPPATPREDRLCYLLRTLMQSYADQHDLGEVYGSRVAFVLGRYHCSEPDLSFISKSRLGLITETHGNAAPDIAVEIVSADSEERDYVEKRVLYERSGVQEYWIIDPLRSECRFLRLTGGRFIEVPLDGSRFRSELLSGFWLDTTWLLADPLPKPSAYQSQVLGA